LAALTIEANSGSASGVKAEALFLNSLRVPLVTRTESFGRRADQAAVASFAGGVDKLTPAGRLPALAELSEKM